MPVRIRLQRHGRKGRPFYWIVAADSRAKRDGKFLEKLGTYNPVTNPAQIELNVNGAVKWLRNGAQPSETARRILSYKGALLKHHLLRGVDKGALTEEQAEEKFLAWIAEKSQKIEDKKDRLAQDKAEARAKVLEAEKEVSDKRKASAEGTEEAQTEAAAESAVEETVATTEAAPETEEVPAEKTPEAAKEAKPKSEAAPEKAVEEIKAESKPEEAAKKDKEKAAAKAAKKSGEDAEGKASEAPAEAADAEDDKTT